MKGSLLAFLILLSWVSVSTPEPCRASSVDDFQAWLGMNTILWKPDQSKWNLSFWTEARFQQNVSEPLGYFVGPGTRYRAHENLDLDFSIRFILFKTNFDDLHLVRYQFAVTPHFRLFENTQFHNRNRVEWITSKGDLVRARIRHQFRLGWQIENRGPLVEIYSSEEFFYNWSEFEINQNRLVPIGLVWKAGSHMKVSTYYMMQYLRLGSTRIHAIGVTAIWILDP